MAEDADIIVWLSSVAERPEWQSGAVWCNQQDKSQAEAESDVETIRTDKSAGNGLAILRIECMLLSSPQFLHLLLRPIIYDHAWGGVVL